MTKLKVAYVLFRFPCITETFIAEEMQKIQDLGIELCIYSLVPSRDKIVQPVSLDLLPLTKKVPGWAHASLWKAQLIYFIRSPKKYCSLLRTLMTQPASGQFSHLKRLAIFLKGIWVAYDLEGKGIQMVHTHFAWLSAAASWVVSSMLDIPYTLTTHAFDIYSVENDLLPLTTTNAASVVTISNYNKQAMLEKVPHLNAEKIHVIHCGIDLSLFTNPTIAANSKKKPQIISVGSLIVKKGHEYLIRACSILKQQEIQFSCLIVGSGFLELTLGKLIKQLDLEQEVTLAGSHDQTWVRDRLAESDLFVLPCIMDKKGGRDGIPVALMEAMAMGVPVISTPVSGIPELIENHTTGLLVRERNVEDLAKAMIELLADSALRESISQNGITRVRRDFDIRANVCELSSIFSEVANPNAPS